MLESLFNNVKGPKVCNFIAKRLQHRCFPLNIVKNFRNSIPLPPLVDNSGRGVLNSPPSFYILMNVYEFFKFSTLGNIYQYGNAS